MLEINTIKKILGIEGELELSSEDMAKKLVVTFFPYDKYNIDNNIIIFGEMLKASLIRVGVKVVPYESTLVSLSFKYKIRWFFRFVGLSFRALFKGSFVWMRFSMKKKVKRGICIISLGEGEEGKLPMDNVMSLRENPIVTIIQQTGSMNSDLTFQQHLEYALSKFAWNMANIIISVSNNSWTLYSYNMSHPSYLINDGAFDLHVLNTLVPKIYAPVVPPRLTDFDIIKGGFNTTSSIYSSYVDDLIESGPLFQKTNLFPAAKKISELKFRNSYYRWLGSVLLDNRSGMSYGYLARQLPTILRPVIDGELVSDIESNDSVWLDGLLYVKLRFDGKVLLINVPDVEVLTSRSGSDKTHLDRSRDIILMGLKNGKMFLKVPAGVDVDRDYKPSFDTRVILAHAVSNAVFASLLKYVNKNSRFAHLIETSGVAIAHWHGYFNPTYIPEGVYYYGASNPTVSCSALQSALYAVSGKGDSIFRSIKSSTEYMGEIHIEPHHGINVVYDSLCSLASYLLRFPDASKLGNEYFKYFEK